MGGQHAGWNFLSAGSKLTWLVILADVPRTLSDSFQVLNRMCT